MDFVKCTHNITSNIKHSLSTIIYCAPIGSRKYRRVLLCIHTAVISWYLLDCVLKAKHSLVDQVAWHCIQLGTCLPKSTSNQLLQAGIFRSHQLLDCTMQNLKDLEKQTGFTEAEMLAFHGH